VKLVYRELLVSVFLGLLVLKAPKGLSVLKVQLDSAVRLVLQA